MARKFRLVATCVLFAAGFAMFGAGFNDANTSNDTVLRVVGGLCLLAALGLFALYVREHATLRTPIGLLSLGAALIGALIMVTVQDQGFWYFLGLICLLGGVLRLAAMGKEEAETGDASAKTA